MYPRDINVSVEPQTFKQSPILRKPIPIYPVTMHRSQVTSMPDTSLNKTNPISLPTFKELEQQFAQNGSLFSQNRMTLPTPNRVTRKKMSMPIVNVASGIEVLLPPAPDLENPLDSTAMVVDEQHPIELPPLDLPVHDKTPNFALSLPSPPSTQSFVSPKSNDCYNMPLRKYPDHYNNPPTPTDSSPPLSPRSATNSDRATLLSCPVTWERVGY
jgi:hypothetical protein